MKGFYDKISQFWPETILLVKSHGERIKFLYLRVLLGLLAGLNMTRTDVSILCNFFSKIRKHSFRDKTMPTTVKVNKKMALV